jgi:hypothetical protein
MANTLKFDVSAAGAIFYNLCLSCLPSEILDDLHAFAERIPALNHEKVTLNRQGSYSINLYGQTFSFKNVQLAPPSLMIGTNYAR